MSQDEKTFGILEPKYDNFSEEEDNDIDFTQSSYFGAKSGPLGNIDGTSKSRPHFFSPAGQLCVEHLNGIPPINVCHHLIYIFL